MCGTWLNHMCDPNKVCTPSVKHIHVRHMSHSYVWCDTVSPYRVYIDTRPVSRHITHIWYVHHIYTECITHIWYIHHISPLYDTCVDIHSVYIWCIYHIWVTYFRVVLTIMTHAHTLYISLTYIYHSYIYITHVSCARTLYIYKVYIDMRHFSLYMHIITQSYMRHVSYSLWGGFD